VRALVRRSSDSDVSDLAAGFKLAYSDVTHADSLAATFDGYDAVFHTAAAVEPWLPDPSLFLVRLNLSVP
jgi:farnesol dehydrogenase